jgi:predicted nucleic acid-binding protein
VAIINLHNSGAPAGCNYILDSNVWLPILGIDNEPTSQHYQIFFDKIFKQDQSKILLCPLQLSEILNRLLRFHANKVYFKKYNGKTGGPTFSEFYKAEYRGSEDCKLQYESIIDDIEGFSSHLIYLDIKNKDLKYLTSFNSKKLDFNDNYLYLLAKENGAAIITHDADFLGLDVTVATYNLKLYKLYTNSIVPKK